MNDAHADPPDAAPNTVPDLPPVTPVHSAELWISNVLRVGVWVSLLLVVGGTVLSFVHHPDYRVSPADLKRLTDPGDAVPHRVADVVDGLRAGRGQAVVELGLLTLIATPVLRVATSAVVFAATRDRAFVAVTLVVLALLLLSFWLGRAES